jgi:hypothetical protein
VHTVLTKTQDAEGHALGTLVWVKLARSRISLLRVSSSPGSDPDPIPLSTVLLVVHSRKASACMWNRWSPIFHARAHDHVQGCCTRHMVSAQRHANARCRSYQIGCVDGRDLSLAMHHSPCRLSTRRMRACIVTTSGHGYVCARWAQ